jgi:hypothetical protein
MKRWYVAILALTMLVACFDGSSCQTFYPPTPVPTTLYPTPSPSATPVASGCNLVFAVRIGQGGATCPLGSGNQMTVGCLLDVTATPVDSNLEPVPIGIHGPDVSWGGDSAVIAIDPRGDNPFNRRVRALSPGLFVVTATNCGRTGEMRGEVS